MGSALVRALESRGYEQILVRSRAELDLTEQVAVRGLLRGGAARTRSSLPPHVSAGFMPTILARPSSFATIC